MQDVGKPTLRKDWNCPWIRRDGKGIKKVLRPEEKQKAPIKTSYNHFYRYYENYQNLFNPKQPAKAKEFPKHPHRNLEKKSPKDFPEETIGILVSALGNLIRMKLTKETPKGPL